MATITSTSAVSVRATARREPADNGTAKFTKQVEQFIAKKFPTEQSLDPWELKGKALRGLPAAVTKAHHHDLALLGANRNHGRAASVYKFALRDGVAYAARYQVIDDPKLADSDRLRIFSSSGKELAIGIGGATGVLTFKTVGAHKRGAQETP